MENFENKQQKKGINRRNFLSGAVALAAATVGDAVLNKEYAEGHFEAVLSNEFIQQQLEELANEFGDRFINDGKLTNITSAIENNTLTISFEFNSKLHSVRIPFVYPTPEGSRQIITKEGDHYIVHEKTIIQGLVHIYMEEHGLIIPLPGGSVREGSA